MFIHFKNVRYEKEPVRTVAEYRCTSGYDIDLYCVASWQPIPHCQKNNTESDVFYNCIISNKKVLLSYRYEIKAAVKSSMGWRNHTTSFRVELPSTYFFMLMLVIHFIALFIITMDYSLTQFNIHFRKLRDRYYSCRSTSFFDTCGCPRQLRL